MGQLRRERTAFARLLLTLISVGQCVGSSGAIRRDLYPAALD
jgi:hypothetical protein